MAMEDRIQSFKRYLCPISGNLWLFYLMCQKGLCRFNQVKHTEMKLCWIISVLLTMPKPLTVWITVNCELQGVKLVLEKTNQRSNCEHLLDHQKSKRFPEKHLFLLCWLRQGHWLCGSQQTVENSSGDGNTRPPELPLEKSVCRPGSNI